MDDITTAAADTLTIPPLTSAAFAVSACVEKRMWKKAAAVVKRVELR